MLTKTVDYIDYLDMPASETLYFNLSRTELIDMIDLEPRLDAWQKKVSEPAPNGQIPMSDIQELLDILKILIEASYGERSDDGKRFRKSKDIFADFKASPAYDAFVFSLFENPDEAVAFMTEILPKGLGESKVVTDAPLPEGEINATEMEVPAWVREERQPTPKELQTMGPEELRLAFQRRTSQQ